ncbi:AraC family transcriptional regulator [Enterococcus sp. AZ109]|uniref:AraC family transcriptional regulator n=1 Tax=Enterococcus sp. AZ109 TaxID=2774634 RepID=UPI003F23CB1E
MQNYFFRSYYYLEHHSLPYLKGIGIGHGGKDYYWDGKNRKDDLVILQYTLAGKGTFEISGQATIQQTDDFFLAEIPSDCCYYGQEDWQFLYVEFSKEIIPWFFPVNQSHAKASACFRQQLMALASRLKEQSELDFFENTQLAYQLIVDLKQELLTKKQEKHPTAEKIKSYLEAHYQEAIGLSNIEEQFQFSKYKCIRLFEEAYDIPPMAYLTRYRVMCSLSLLTEGKQTIHEIAQQVGFANGNYFAKVFKKELGQSPSEYQKSKQVFKTE